MGTAELEIAASRLSLHDQEAEMSVLGAMLLDPAMALTLCDQLDPADFYKPGHATLFDCLRQLHLGGGPVDQLTVRHALEQKGRLQDVGGDGYLILLMQSTPITANAEHYARLVREKALKRQVARACQEVLRELEEPGMRAEELLNSAQSRIFSIAQSRADQSAVSMKEIIESTFKEIHKLYQLRDRKNRLVGLATGLYDLDDLLCGLQPAHMYVVAGRPGMGKSSLCFRIMETTSLPKTEEPKPVLFFSLEMSALQVSQAMLCSYCKIDSHHLRRGLFSDPDLKNLAIGAGKLSDAPIWVDDNPDLTILDIRARARRMKQKHGIALILIDYLQKIRGEETNRRDGRQVEIANISSQIKSMAKELDVPVLAVAQLNRSPEGREDKRPILSDLRESGAIEQDADVVMMVYREEYYKRTEENANKCLLDVVKNRTGPVREVNVVFKKEWTRFENATSYEAAP
jgi:replicative DNA helicase